MEALKLKDLVRPCVPLNFDVAPGGSERKSGSRVDVADQKVVCRNPGVLEDVDGLERIARDRNNRDVSSIADAGCGILCREVPGFSDDGPSRAVLMSLDTQAILPRAKFSRPWS
jgi:hypothetical protein